MAVKSLLYIIEGRDSLTPVMSKASAKMSVLGETAGKSFGQKMAKGLSVVGPMAMAAVAVGFGFAIKAGMEVPLAQLKVTLKNAGTSFDAMKNSINGAQDRMAKLGFTGAEVDQSIINLTRSTGDANLALKMQGTVADLARAKHISLAEASMMLAKAAEGMTRGLRGFGVSLATGTTKAQALVLAEKMVAGQFGTTAQKADFAAKHHLSLAQVSDLVTKAAHGNIGALNTLGIAVLPKTASAAERMAQVQKVLNERIGGTAAKQAATFGGQLQVLRAQFTNLAEKIGLMILPYLAKFIGLLNKLAGYKPLIIGIAVVIGALAFAFLALKVAALAAWVAENLALLGIPLAIAAAVAAIVLIVKHWQAVRDGFIAAWNWLKAHPWVTLMIPFIGVILLIATHWRGLWTGIQAIWHAMSAGWRVLCGFFSAAWNAMCGLIKSAWNATGAWFGRVWQVFVQMWRGIAGSFRVVWDGLCGAFRATWNAVGAWFGRVWAIFVKMWQGICAGLQYAWGALIGVMKKVWQAVGGWFQGVWNIFVKIWQGVCGAVQFAWGLFIGGIKRAWTSFHGWIVGMWNGLKNVATTVWNAIRDA
jgi:hypothetical protein